MMNYCIPDMYDLPHAGFGGYGSQADGDHCMYPGQGTQPLHHPPCVDPAWPPSQLYSCYDGDPAVFKSELYSVDLYQQQPEFFPELRADFSHLQWLQGDHKKGTETRGRPGSAAFRVSL